ncbi:endonuclease/exonuclease/phosphatase family protein [Sphingobacterium bovisgrunnientis]|jgi:exodeoxyribonuclease-3|uniref:endonuclease/exonuclease/phosphatase family protein n=1 Tax=Sphingobacterium bovisgrunnientis TaxID=1874697 RepID=UPI001356C4A7|nr:endonuclease/exonuclease/phosphatase family protein [Sphingobacterium bovisgrunnientis]
MERIKLKIINIQHIFPVFLVLLVLFSCSKSEDNSPIDGGNNPIPDVDETLPDTLKIISYNILEGMKNDRSNNYNKFVDWIKSYAPDVLALQEVNGFNQRKLEELAKRYGHSYVITNLKSTDNYPVAITSKYPIESRRRITLHTSHGAIFAKLKNTDINIVNTHFWPQTYWKSVGDGRGDEYRLQEANVNLDSTIRKFPNEKSWLYLGDFNAVNRKDYDAGTTNQSFLVLDEIQNAGFLDVVHHLHGYKLNNTANYAFNYPGRRIDFIFGTTEILSKVTKAMPIYDEFTAVYSDHPPIMVHILNK